MAGKDLAWHEKLVERFKSIITDGDKVFDEDDIIDAVRGNVDIDTLAKEIIKEDLGIKEAIRESVRDLLYREIENTDDINDLLEDDLIDYFPDIAPMVKGLLENDDHIRGALEAAVAKAVEEAIEDLDYEELGLTKAFEAFDFESFSRDAIRYGDLDDRMRARVKEVAEEYIDDFFGPDDLPENFPEMIGINAEIEKLSKSPQFQEKLREELLPLLVNNFKDIMRNMLFASDSPYRQTMEATARSMINNMFKLY